MALQRVRLGPENRQGRWPFEFRNEYLEGWFSEEVRFENWRRVHIWEETMLLYLSEDLFRLGEVFDELLGGCL